MKALILVSKSRAELVSPLLSGTQDNEKKPTFAVCTCVCVCVCVCMFVCGRV